MELARSGLAGVRRPRRYGVASDSTPFAKALRRKITWKETIEHGIENAPTAFLKLFKGDNFGKMLVKLR
jgi:hypothetical protein